MLKLISIIKLFYNIFDYVSVPIQVDFLNDYYSDDLKNSIKFQLLINKEYNIHMNYK